MFKNMLLLSLLTCSASSFAVEEASEKQKKQKKGYTIKNDKSHSNDGVCFGGNSHN
jgi:hypothetical protein